ncbi:lipid II flippase family protein [Bacillus sp. S14(2024)]|uniref:lipid II flippase family protein n=1 Tax=Bacillus sp. S14(2024) TaxID=3162884 RepID=UPI003D1AF3BC
MDFITFKVIGIFVFLMLMTSIEVLGYGVRLVGAKLALVASAFAIYNILSLVARFSNMFQQPFTASLVDSATQNGGLELLDKQFRFLLLGSTMGVILGGLLVPFFMKIFSKSLVPLSKDGSFFNLFKLINKTNYKKVKNYFVIVNKTNLEGVNFKNISFKLFIINTIVSAVFTVGVMSALYATLLVPQYDKAAMSSSNIITGVATILLTLIIDPKLSFLTDKVVQDNRNYGELKTFTFMILLSRLLGTLMAQIILVPGAYYIAWFAKIIS